MAEIFVKPDKVFTEEVQDRKRFERIQNTNPTEYEHYYYNALSHVIRKDVISFKHNLSSNTTHL